MNIDSVSFPVLGVCPQQNVLFDFLTVKEHLEFYSGLKEVTGDATDRMVMCDFVFKLTKHT